jgi:hypothetical protein
MENINVNEVPLLVDSGEISIKDAVNIIAEQIYLHPNQFGLFKYDDDFKSDIIIAFLQQAHVLFERYDSRQGKFSSYLYSFLHGLVLTQRRNKMKQTFSENCIKQEEINESELSITKYIPSEENFVTPDRYVFREIPTPVENFCKKKKSIEIKTAMVLALKSSYYLSDHHIEILSSYCGVSKENLIKTIADLNKSLLKRAEHRKQLCNRRDNAYYFHRKYNIQLNYSPYNKSNTMQLTAKYQKQTMNWQNKNKLLQKTGYRVCPTNKTIAKILGVCERQISYYISRAKLIKKSNQKK